MSANFSHHPHSGDGANLPPVPSLIRSRDGAIVETHTTIWRLGGNAKVGKKFLINWDLLDPYPFLTERGRHLLKLYVSHQITKKRASTITSIYCSLRHFLRWLASHGADLSFSLVPATFNWSDVTEGQARAFLEWSVKHTAEKGIYFVHLRAFYEWGIARGYGDFQRAILLQLKSIKAPNNPKGHHVRFRHPSKGPFSSDELFQIRSALQDGKGTDQDRALVTLHLELGLNPFATIQLINADFRRYETEQLIAYQLDVPRIKKRTIHRETKRRPISNTLGQLLEQLQQGGPEDPLLNWLAPLCPEESLLTAMRRFVKVTGITASDTGARLPISPRRFRTSLATAMAAQGASKFHIAEILDHTDLQTADIYTQTVSSIADQVAKATDSQLQPLVHRFLGKIADGPEKSSAQEASRPLIPAFTPHLPLPMVNVGGIGSCGKKDGLCRLLPPLSCYLCPYFVAFRQGPHQEMLGSLLAFLQHNGMMADERIKGQLDDVCLAIAEVLAQVRGSS
jgi:integrase